jgi:ubiquinol oxidase
MPTTSPWPRMPPTSTWGPCLQSQDFGLYPNQPFYATMDHMTTTTASHASPTSDPPVDTSTPATDASRSCTENPLDTRPLDTRPGGAMAEFGHQELADSHALTLSTPRRSYGLEAQALFALLDAVYGKKRTLSKFKVLELVARVPYQAWEQAGYIAVTHTHHDPSVARRVFDRVTKSRSQEDNEQWHLLILQEMITASGLNEGWVRYSFLPQLLAFVYYQLSFVLYAIRPKWSYRLNADFEDHAEHEYANPVLEHPEWETKPFESAFAGDYASLDSVADLFRQVSYDERIHKNDSVTAMAGLRFA